MPRLDLLLSDEALLRLSPEEQRRYLSALQAHLETWELSPVQAEADQLADQVDELLYGGAAGGGKSELVIWHADRWSKAVRGHRSLLLRKAFPELRRSLIQRSLLRIDPKRAHYRVGDKEWHYDNGSVIEFGFCDTDEDVRQFLSAEYDLICIDESTDFTKYRVEMLRSRLRTSRAKRKQGVKPHMILCSNPGGVGHGWHKQRYLLSTDYGEHIATETVAVGKTTRHRSLAFLRARVDDNPYIDPDYKVNLASMPEVQRRQFLEGDWDVFAGQFFGEFNRDTHVVEPFEIPRNWFRALAVDFGFIAPYCCLWGAWDPDGRCYIYREDYGPGVTLVQQAHRIRDLSLKDRVSIRVGDPSGWHQRGVGKSEASQYREAGVVLTKAINSRQAGWHNVREYLREWEDGRPGVLIFRSCLNLTRELPELLYDPNKPEDTKQGTGISDHAADAMRYLLGVRPVQRRQVRDVARNYEERIWQYVRKKQRRGLPIAGQ